MTPDALAAIRDLMAIVTATGHHLVLIGAHAREVAFDRRIGNRSPRATRDIDAAVRWPNDPTRTMSLAGFEMLDAHAVDADLGGLILPVANLCDLLALKLFAFDDRGNRTTKDLEDLAFILEHATDALHDRAFEELDGHELIARPYEEYGALLLGRDLRARFDDTTRERLAAIVRRAARRVSGLPGVFLASSPGRTDDLLERFSALEAGILARDG